MAPSCGRLGAGCRLVRGRVHQRHDAPPHTRCLGHQRVQHAEQHRRIGEAVIVQLAEESNQAGAPLRFTKVVALDRRAGTLYHSINDA